MLHRPFICCALAALAVAGAQSGQSGSSGQLPDVLSSISFLPDPNGRPFTLYFSQRVPLARCSIDTYQTGDFGALGLPAPPLSGVDTGTVFTIRTGNNGKPAKTLKVAVWCPGFASEAIEIADLPAAKAEASLALKPLRNVTITGRILPGEDGVSLAGAELVAYYEALWARSLFGYADGMDPQWEVARTRITADASFRLEVPDFMNDPTVARFRLPGSFTFRADRKTPPHRTWLETDSRGGYLPVAAKYPPLRLQRRRF